MLDALSCWFRGPDHPSLTSFPLGSKGCMHPLPSRFILILNKAEVDHEQTLFISFPHQSSCEGHALALAAPSRPCRLCPCRLSSSSLTAIAASRRPLPPPPPLPLPLDPATAAPSPFPLPALSPSRSVRAHCHRYPRFRATCTRASKMSGCERSVGEPIVFRPALWITTRLTLDQKTILACNTVAQELHTTRANSGGRNELRAVIQEAGC